MASEQVVVVMVPFLAQGHLNQLLNLSRLISAYNIPIHFISTETYIRQARKRLHGWNPNNHIRFHEVQDPELTSPPPDPNAKSHFPTHLQVIFNSTLQLRHPVADLIRSLSRNSQRVAVVHDTLMTYVVQDVKEMDKNVQTYVFRPLSVFHFFCSAWENLGRELPFEVNTIRRLPSSPSLSMSQDFVDFVKLQYAHSITNAGSIYDSSRVIEEKFLKLLEKEEISGKNHWAVGPFNPIEIGTDDPKTDHHIRHKCLQWLDKQPASSVIYVSFGTTTTFTNEQITELAIGLERSEQRFLWVLRGADKGDVFDKDGPRVMLPEGFEERVKGRGLVVREWAPQLEILGHLSTGGFVSHCGWNSCMEAMTRGVVIAAWPIHTDQPYNAILLTDVLRIAVVMRDWVSRDELLTSVAVEKVVRMLMESGEGQVIRKRAAEYGGELRRSMLEGGIGHKELNSLISHIRGRDMESES
uniref:zeatin O-glucosyltransferase-like n=1 Tax=Erigeron canadensis TaxID=72917 RepID=UPI001CB924AA|nr:zeatin O-glucosyltransferase-like [Erigeron canadensis]